MKTILFFLALVPAFAFAQSAKTAKETKSSAKEATAPAVEKAPSKAEKTKTTTVAPGVAGAVYVCGSSDVYHTDRNCSALKRCKSEPTVGMGKAKSECKICAKSKGKAGSGN